MYPLFSVALKKCRDRQVGFFHSGSAHSSAFSLQWTQLGQNLEQTYFANVGNPFRKAAPGGDQLTAASSGKMVMDGVMDGPTLPTGTACACRMVHHDRPGNYWQHGFAILHCSARLGTCVDFGFCYILNSNSNGAIKVKGLLYQHTTTLAALSWAELMAAGIDLSWFNWGLEVELLQFNRFE